MKFLQSLVSCELYKYTTQHLSSVCLYLQTSCNDKLQTSELGCITGSSGILTGPINIATVLIVGRNYLVFQHKMSKY